MFTDPVVGIDFYDRSYFLNTLIKRAQALEEGYRQNIALLGPEAIGKTSLLLQLLSKIQGSSRLILPIYLEITYDVPYDHLINRFLAVTLFNFFKIKYSIAPPENLDILLEKLKSLLPRTTEEVKRCLDLVRSNRLDESYSAMLSLPQTLSQESGNPVILILEEFHRLEKLPLRDSLGTLAKKIMVSKNVMHIISSSSVTAAKKILSRELSLLFGNFEVLHLGPFDIKTGEAFIEHKTGPVKCSAYYRQFITEITNGEPLYLNIISTELKSLARVKKLHSVTDEVIVEALSRLLFNSEGILNQIFIHRINQLPTNRSPISYASTLLALGHGCLKMKQIKDYLNRKSEKELLNHLTSLLEIDCIYRNGGLYYLHDELFKLWLIDVYENKKSSLEIHNDLKEIRFRDAVKNRLNHFLEDRQKNTVERVRDLFALFNSEIIFLNNKRIKLPNFRSLEIKNIQGSTPVIIGRTKDKPWALIIKKNHINETAMAEVVSSCKKQGNRYSHRIAIALDGADEDARLVAKEEKFVLLELAEVNQILKLFGKNKIFPE